MQKVLERTHARSSLMKKTTWRALKETRLQVKREIRHGSGLRGLWLARFSHKVFSLFRSLLFFKSLPYSVY